MSHLLFLPAPGQSLAIPPVPSPDDQLVALWLHGRGPHTRRAYEADLGKLRAFAPKPLEQITLADLQAFADSLGGKDTSRRRTLSTVKSLFTFAVKIGYLALNPAAALRVPKVRETLAERILTESEVFRLIHAAGSKRNIVLCALLYASGIRATELTALRWRDTSDRGNGQGQITVFGKGSKTRAVLLSASAWSDLQSLRGEATDDAIIFQSRQGDGSPLSTVQVERIVKAAAKAAGIRKNVVPHAMRHSAASHAADRGCPMHVIQQSLGHASLSTSGRYLHCRPGDSLSLYLAS